ncbi:MAG: hydroxymethylglutaryl-CoA lyase [Sphingomonadales bacterium]|nr:hydroxymethylglutaryl-CoA lyase [Sphingomonadales bacterium]
MSASTSIKLIECPRDAMQGWPHPIATADKVRYIQSLLRVGFDTLDLGSFVSAKAIPQMADTADVLSKLSFDNSVTKSLVIVANERGANEAISFPCIQYLGFPFSVSETFQQRNTRSGRQQALDTVVSIAAACHTHNKELVIYLSMAFGNPYQDPYHQDEVLEWAYRLSPLGATIFSLADTVGLATPEQVFQLTKAFKKEFAGIETGLHLHAAPNGWKQKVEAGLLAGCTRFDAALGGVGGCPMAADSLVSNLNMEWLAEWVEQKGYVTTINKKELVASAALAAKLFV